MVTIYKNGRNRNECQHCTYKTRARSGRSGSMSTYKHYFSPGECPYRDKPLWFHQLNLGVQLLKNRVRSWVPMPAGHRLVKSKGSASGSGLSNLSARASAFSGGKSSCFIRYFHVSTTPWIASSIRSLMFGSGCNQTFQ